MARDDKKTHSGLQRRDPSTEEHNPGKFKMNAIKNERYRDKLRKRRSETMRTLEHLQIEQRTVNENKNRIDDAAYESRCRLLANLADWYANETALASMPALRRIASSR